MRFREEEWETVDALDHAASGASEAEESVADAAKRFLEAAGYEDKGSAQFENSPNA